MSGVYIKGMEMPGVCLACDFCNPFVNEPYCRRLMKIIPKTARLPDCPITAVPDHGRLIDADADIQLTLRLMSGGHCGIDLIATTIIPADKEADKEADNG